MDVFKTYWTDPPPPSLTYLLTQTHAVYLFFSISSSLALLHLFWNSGVGESGSFLQGLPLSVSVHKSAVIQHFPSVMCTLSH